VADPKVEPLANTELGVGVATMATANAMMLIFGTYLIEFSF